VLSCLVASCDGSPGRGVPNTRAPTASPTPPRSPVPSAFPSPEDTEIVLVAAGDLVCNPAEPAFDGSDPSQCQHRATAALVGDADAVLVLGDLQYERGSLGAFRGGYDRSWGRFADITYPALGNHDRQTTGAAGYFDYWVSKGRPTGDRRSGFYSFDLGTWHLIALDSTCLSGCGEGSAQDAFLERDLARARSECVLAYWHHPLFNSGAVHGEEMLPNVRALWDDLFAAGADVVLNGHEHNYQRYAEQSPAGDATPRGIRQFVVGTGGRSLYELLDRKDPNYEVGAVRFGVLRLFLHDASYSWEFVGVGGAVRDRGGPTSCS
jgi:acid phosphatase type 7